MIVLVSLTSNNGTILALFRLLWLPEVSWTFIAGLCILKWTLLFQFHFEIYCSQKTWGKEWKQCQARPQLILGKSMPMGTEGRCSFGKRTTMSVNLWNVDTAMRRVGPVAFSGYELHWYALPFHLLIYASHLFTLKHQYLKTVSAILYTIEQTCSERNCVRYHPY